MDNIKEGQKMRSLYEGVALAELVRLIEETIQNFKGLREKSDQVKEKNMSALNKFKKELDLCKK